MSQPLSPLTFPLYGSRLIEASAGTGKTWTIAALYVRLVLNHGDDQAFGRPLSPGDILVMTFTRAATRELSDRIRARLIEAAACFRGERLPEANDHFLQQLILDFADDTRRSQAAHRLMLAAESMDDAAVFTIDAWCQRMLREHAFDSGNLFDEELVPDEAALFDDAVRDYWRQHVYPLDDTALEHLLGLWSDVSALQAGIAPLVSRVGLLEAVATEPLGGLIERTQRLRQIELTKMKSGWAARADRMQAWIEACVADNPKCFNGTKLKLERAAGWFDALRAWAEHADAVDPGLNETAWRRLTADGILDACGKGISLSVPDDFDAVADLQTALAALPDPRPELLRHAACVIARRMDDLKRQAHQFGFADMLERLRAALEGGNGEVLRQRIVTQYPVALVDEFQDTAPTQYRIFDLLYQTENNRPDTGLFLIGDPKQSIYAFRGADINSYLAARRATEGRHYLLDTNFRSTREQVDAVNRLFLTAEGDANRTGHARGAFLFREGEDNPVPYEAVSARGRKERLVSSAGAIPALTFWFDPGEALNAAGYRRLFAAQCAEHLVSLLNDPCAGFLQPDGTLERLRPADVAILVRDRNEASAILSALQRRQVACVYLSDKDSVLDSAEAADLLRWLQAVASPLDGALARAALATATVGLPLAALIELASDDLAWEARVEQLKQWQRIWQRQGVLALIRQMLHQLELPSRLLAEPGGERRLTNVLHLAELLQGASLQLDGEQALIRWLAEQIESPGHAGDDRVLRLESDADLVKVVTVHKSKGLEYPLVYLPFAVTARPVERKGRDYFEISVSGKRQLDFSLSDESMQQADAARLAEDLRLLYVALTRARHALWLGVAPVPGLRKNTNKLHECALGYLLGAGEPMLPEVAEQRLVALADDGASIAVEGVHLASRVTALARGTAQAALVDAPRYAAHFERNWSVGSFTSLTRDMATAHVPIQPQQQKMLEYVEDEAGDVPEQGAPWHRFPRGALAGNFLHEQLEWLAEAGFDFVDHEDFDLRLSRRCDFAGWGHRHEEVGVWLRALAHTTLPPLATALSRLNVRVPEMEFWLPSHRLNAAALDRLCRAHLLDRIERPDLPARELHGMLKGYADLVLEHEGRYWIIDYKSNALGEDDRAYHPAALTAAMAAHRYDVQAAIYMLALHRLLKSRLGASYDPARQFGGAVFLFLRGIESPDRGCHVVPAEADLLDALDALLIQAHTGHDTGEYA